MRCGIRKARHPSPAASRRSSPSSAAPGAWSTPRLRGLLLTQGHPVAGHHHVVNGLELFPPLGPFEKKNTLVHRQSMARKSGPRLGDVPRYYDLKTGENLFCEP